METTTIQITKETKELISSWGLKGDSYDDIVRRLYDKAVKDQLREFLMSSKDCISIEEARELINN